jgi:tRNA(Ile)-lysidine synthetase-like protein
MTDWGGSAVGLEQRLLSRFRGAGIPVGAPLVVAFSGGPDSLALAAALTHVRAVTGVPLHLVHVDHALRESSQAEAQAAAELGRQLGLDVIVRRVPGPPSDAHPGAGLEEAARRERYRLLYEEAHRIGAEFIATAHHREDQAETVLLHLLRGSGLRGAAGMAEVAGLPLAQSDISHRDEVKPVRLWRPFLEEPRTRIRAFLQERRLTPLHDPSNDDVTLRRNALRHRVLPELEEVVPGASMALARYAALASEEDRFLEGLVDRVYPGMVGPEGLQLAALLGEARTLQRRIVRRWLVQATCETTIGAERVDAVLRWADGAATGSRIELPGGWQVRRSRQWLIVERNTSGRVGEELGP